MKKIFTCPEDIIVVKNGGEEQIGKGSYAKVNLVRHQSDSKTFYAMKTVFKRSKVEDALITKEINLHKTLNHRNIIQFIDYLDLPDRVYIFLEYAKNGDLFTYLQKHKPKDEEKIRIFYQTCQAIKYIHSKNIMHRDLKPENILLDDNLNVKLCDFGYSAEYFENINRETLCGTFEYMAPEIFFRNKQTKKTDVWALGILLYELFHGYAPFRGIRIDTVIQAIMKNVVAFKKNLYPEVKNLVIKILIFDPKKRPDIHEIIQHKLITNYLKRYDHQDKSSKENKSIGSKKRLYNVEMGRRQIASAKDTKFKPKKERNVFRKKTGPTTVFAKAQCLSVEKFGYSTKSGKKYKFSLSNYYKHQKDFNTPSVVKQRTGLDKLTSSEANFHNIVNIYENKQFSSVSYTKVSNSRWKGCAVNDFSIYKNTKGPDSRIYTRYLHK